MLKSTAVPHVTRSDDTSLIHDTTFLSLEKAGAETSEGAAKPPSARGPFALLILNCNRAVPGVCAMPPILNRLYALSSFVMCADGGANRLYDMSSLGGEYPRKSALHDKPPMCDLLTPLSSSSAFKPDVIKGDLDSIRPDVKSHYEKLGVEILQDDSVDTNDLEKCLWHLREVDTRFGIVCVYGGLGGRFDQTMSSGESTRIVKR